MVCCLLSGLIWKMNLNQTDPKLRDKLMGKMAFSTQRSVCHPTCFTATGVILCISCKLAMCKLWFSILPRAYIQPWDRHAITVVSSCVGPANARAQLHSSLPLNPTALWIWMPSRPSSVWHCGWMQPTESHLRTSTAQWLFAHTDADLSVWPKGDGAPMFSSNNPLPWAAALLITAHWPSWGHLPSGQTAVCWCHSWVAKTAGRWPNLPGWLRRRQVEYKVSKLVIYH